MIFFFIPQAKRILLRPGTLLISGLILLAGLAGVLASSGDAHRRQWLMLGNDIHAPVHWLFSVGFVLVTLALQQRPYAFFVNPLTIFLGRISFSVYLAHFAIFTLLHRVGCLRLFR
ncbi:hypothetical protein [Hymenobacter cellulosilyticus]|uniref:Uncharacterized protein n=1 Tax=Hymenobacter cellulosilyticus TaxID=2932248 RepID=A0A8T9Q0L7_9BACT|nr:hypothetical protein MUN79_20185 [Hymenobacter cellulosilyticus]